MRLPEDEHQPDNQSHKLHPYESDLQAEEKIPPAPGDIGPADATTGPEHDGLHRRAPGAPLFPIVGLGASAGGVTALREFFRAVPADSGIAYVVILHLSPDHESNLAELLGHDTSLLVQQVRERVKLEANHVYVIAPDLHLSMQDGHLQVSEPETTRGRRVPIDLFFRTLAEAHDSAACVVVLSGTGSDGTIGTSASRSAMD